MKYTTNNIVVLTKEEIREEMLRCAKYIKDHINEDTFYESSVGQMYYAEELGDIYAELNNGIYLEEEDEEYSEALEMLNNPYLYGIKPLNVQINDAYKKIRELEEEIAKLKSLLPEREFEVGYSVIQHCTTKIKCRTPKEAKEKLEELARDKKTPMLIDIPEFAEATIDNEMLEMVDNVYDAETGELLVNVEDTDFSIKY